MNKTFSVVAFSHSDYPSICDYVNHQLSLLDTEQVDIKHYNVDNELYARHFTVLAIPAYIIFKNNIVKTKLSAKLDDDSFVSWVYSNLEYDSEEQ